MKRIGFIGLGIMGRPMSQNLLKSGFPLTVYNRSKAPVELLASLGATAAKTPKEVAEKSEVIITMVTDSPDVEQVVLGDNGIIQAAVAGKTVIDMSTISPAVTRKISKELSRKGTKMLDAPVSGGDKGAREATLTIMVGGPKDVYEECLPIFQALGKRVTYMGGTGSGQLAKLANQILVAINMIGVCECLVFGRKSGLDLKNLIEALSAGAASSWSLVNLGPKAADGDFSPGFKLRLLQKDLRHVLSTAAESKVALPASSLVNQLYNTLEAEGRGEEGTQALFTVLERLSGLRR